MTPKGLLLLFLAPTLAGLLALALQRFAATWIIPVTLSLGVFSQVLFWLWLRSRLNGVRESVGAQNENTIRQVDSLFSLYAALAGQLPLPPTRGWAASPDVLRLIAVEISMRRPGLVVELGSGVSTLVLGKLIKAYAPTGRLISIEHDHEFSEVISRRVRQAGLDDVVEIVHCPLIDFSLDQDRWRWFDLPRNFPDGDQNIDILFVDGPPGIVGRMARYPALPVLRSRIAIGGIVILDDADREDEREITRRWAALPGIESRAEHCEKGAVVFTIRKETAGR